jgi:hypothetical protein
LRERLEVTNGPLQATLSRSERMGRNRILLGDPYFTLA